MLVLVLVMLYTTLGNAFKCGAAGRTTTFSRLLSSKEGPWPVVTSTQEAYTGWRSVVSKQATYPDGSQHRFDVVTQGSPSVLVVPWCTRTRTTTLLREWQPGPEEVLWGVCAGIVEPGKHASNLQAAQYELNEEAQLESHMWLSVLDRSAPADKYSDNRFDIFLAMDCSPVGVQQQRNLDSAERIDIYPGVSYKRVMDIIEKGEMNVAGSFACMVAFRALERKGYPLV